MARCLQRLSLDSFYKAAIPEQLAAQQERDAERSSAVVHPYMTRQKTAQLAAMHRVHTLQRRSKSSNWEEVESAAVAVSYLWGAAAHTSTRRLCYSIHLCPAKTDA